MMIKAPRFDEPRTRGVSGPMPADAYTFPVKSGTRVTVVYMGKEVLIQVVDVIKPDGVFAGKVLEIDQAFAPLGELIVGDKVRFSRRDIHWIDAPTKSPVSRPVHQRPSDEGRSTASKIGPRDDQAQIGCEAEAPPAVILERPRLGLTA
jgi:hypothetical protein